MTTSTIHTNLRAPAISDFISSDFLALASHMQDCHRSRGRFFGLRASAEVFRGVMSVRIVTTCVIFLLCGLGLFALA